MGEKIKSRIKKHHLAKKEKEKQTLMQAFCKYIGQLI
jgi:hypothetical protein